MRVHSRPLELWENKCPRRLVSGDVWRQPEQINTLATPRSSLLEMEGSGEAQSCPGHGETSYRRPPCEPVTSSPFLRSCRNNFLGKSFQRDEKEVLRALLWLTIFKLPLVTRGLLGMRLEKVPPGAGEILTLECIDSPFLYESGGAQQPVITTQAKGRHDQRVSSEKEFTCQ